MGLRCADGIVLAVEKPLPSKMLLSSSSRRIHTVDSHSGVAFTGFVSDARQIMNRAREEAANYDATYGTKIPPALLAQRIASYVHYFTLHGSLRPFGAATILASYDPSTKQHELHMIEPSGVTYEFFGCAAGKGRQAAKTEMEKLSLGNVSGTTGEVITAKEAVKQLARIICLLHEDEKESSSSKPFELEMSWVCQESKWEHVGVPRQIIAEAMEWAKENIAEEDDEDDEADAGGEVMAF